MRVMAFVLTLAGLLADNAINNNATWKCQVQENMFISTSVGLIYGNCYFSKFAEPLRHERNECRVCATCNL